MNKQTNPVLTTQLQEKLVGAMDLNKRIWRVIKDRTNTTASTVASILGQDKHQVSVRIGKMRARGMLVRDEETFRTRRVVYVYNVPKHHPEFEMLPVPKVTKMSKASAAAEADALEAQIDKVQTLIGNLKVHEAKALLSTLDDLQGKLQGLSGLEIEQMHRGLQQLFKG